MTPTYLNEWNGDSHITLSSLAELIPMLQAKYGEDATIWFDAGYNNVQVMVNPTKVKNGNS